MTVSTSSQSNTGTQNPHYNLISVLYHLLQGAETYDQYIQDAEREGDQELADFFKNLKQASSSTADKAKDLLRQRLQ
ncbi:hypothetical protein [Gloeothece verrucosa]|uniref:Ferritin-like diiron domain-containing protein n=1 Tax=Gloeothece verrucosa (strain PCC 7822) TaxID=497965 RepID=E0UFW5_GLOV7|nr:hypothetical protein [Gloeothece verrucosa]ADN14348.1 hypothetical protein Cyan7822_2372 [Gloeothece verrucosa PCC 7822]